MKATVLVIVLVLLVSMLFFGCTQTEQKITTPKAASAAIVDVGTDISGISESLGEIDKSLSDTNSAK
ncbi:MAG: hypothetical protein WCW13_04480 [archaeon]